MKQKSRRLPITLSIIGGIIIVLALVITVFFNSKLNVLEIGEISLSETANGTYIGDAYNGIVKAKVEVSVENGIITHITILEHDNMLGKPAEEITKDIIEQQSLNVDAVSTATYSSNTILKAVENALESEEK